MKRWFIRLENNWRGLNVISIKGLIYADLLINLLPIAIDFFFILHRLASEQASSKSQSWQTGTKRRREGNPIDSGAPPAKVVKKEEKVYNPFVSIICDGLIANCLSLARPRPEAKTRRWSWRRTRATAIGRAQGQARVHEEPEPHEEGQGPWSREG